MYLNNKLWLTWLNIILFLLKLKAFSLIDTCSIFFSFSVMTWGFQRCQLPLETLEQRSWHFHQLLQFLLAWLIGMYAWPFLFLCSSRFIVKKFCEKKDFHCASKLHSLQYGLVRRRFWNIKLVEPHFDFSFSSNVL